MRQVKMSGVVLVAMLAAGLISATVVSAHEFEASKAPGLLLGKAEGLRIFTTPDGTLTCEAAVAHGVINEIRILTKLMTVSYSSCTTSLGTVAEPINAQYIFSADNGAVSIEAPIKIEISAAGVKCHILVPAQNSLKTITYSNLSGKILVATNLEKVESSASGAACPNYTSNKTGKTTGTAIVELVGGQIQWT